jgi:hypothetical protein
MNPRQWRADSDDFLRMHYDRNPVSWIATKMSRTTKSIYHRAQILGLAKTQKQPRIEEESTDRQPGDPTPEQIRARAARIRFERDYGVRVITTCGTGT